MISSSEECRACHPKMVRAFAGFATSSGGSPARRGRHEIGNSLPVVLITCRITCKTEQTWPVPRFKTSDAPSENR